MKTKYLLRYLNRAAHFDADLELADVLATAVKQGRLQSAGNKIFDFVEPAKHPRLSRRKDSDQSRTLAITHLKSTLHASFVKDLYEDAMKYMQELLRGAATKGLSPARLVGPHKVSFSANDVLAAKGWTGVIQMVSDSLFRAIENERSTKKLLEAIDNKLGLGVDQTIVDGALPYLDLRHLLVHQDGVADGSFCKRNPGLGAVVGKKIALPYRVVAKARANVEATVREYDKKAVAAGVCPNKDLQP